MAKGQYDTTVHEDEHHYNAKIAARHADREALVAASRHVRQDLGRTIHRIEGTLGNERRAQEIERERLEQEARRIDTAIKEHDDTKEGDDA